MKKRLLSALIAVCLCLGLAVPALAAKEDFVIENGVLVRYTGLGGDIVVPDGVTKIGAEAFYGFFDPFTPELRVTLPASVRVIGERAFTESTLSAITLPEGLTAIEDMAFAECGQLTSITLPSSLKTIGDEAFDNCVSLSRADLPSGLTSIGRNGFAFCKLTQADVPAGVSLGQNAFYGNPIEKATLGGRSPSQKELSAYFYETPLYFGAASGGDQGQKTDPSLFTIENGVLIRCTAASGTVAVPDGVTVIGDGEGRVFDRGVMKVVLPDSVRTIAAHAFEDSTIQEVNLPQGVSRIAPYAFRNCDYLKQIVIPSAVTVVGAYAFQGCAALTSVTLPEGLTALENCAFSGCTALTAIALPSSLQEIGESAFSSCPLTSVTLPKGLRKLGNGALSYTALTSLTLPESLEELGISVVSGCKDLTTVTFPTSGKVVEGLRDATASAFLERLGQCPALEEVVNPASRQLAQRLETYRTLFEGVDPKLWVVQQSEAVTAKSNEITAGLSGDYEKARAIYRWVAQNITYDYSYFRGETASTSSKPEDVLKYRRAVCGGYSRLTKALLQAQGIPAVYVHGYTGSTGHAWNAAYIDGRWIWIDSTWGRPGNTQDLYDPRYFDPTDFFLARTHEAAPVKSNNFKAGDKGQLPAEPSRPDPQDVPSSWAQEQVDSAIRAGLIPEDLQGAYRSDITREEFCRLMVALVEKKTGMSAAAYARSKGLALTDPFTDTHHADVLAAYALGIVKGTSATVFNPKGSITRQEAATMLARTAKVLGLAAGESMSFQDAGSVASWAKEGVSFTSGLVDPVTGDRVMGGTGGGKFSPLAPYTREQAYLTALRLFHCGK